MTLYPQTTIGILTSGHIWREQVSVISPVASQPIPTGQVLLGEWTTTTATDWQGHALLRELTKRTTVYQGCVPQEEPTVIETEFHILWSCVR